MFFLYASVRLRSLRVNVIVGAARCRVRIVVVPVKFKNVNNKRFYALFLLTAVSSSLGAGIRA